MAMDLVDLVKGYLTPEVIQEAATRVGESSSSTQKALAGIVPTLVGALTNMASTSDGAQHLLRTLEAGPYDGSVLNNVAGFLGDGVATQRATSAGRDILASLFGAKTDGVSDLIARFAGVRMDSASSLLALAAPLVLHVLGRQRASTGPGASSLASLLDDQRGSLAGLVPAGLASVLASGSGMTSGVAELGSGAAGRRSSWIVPLIILGVLVLGLLAWLVWPTSSTSSTSALGPVRPEERKISELYLPGRVRISVPEGSVNFNLAHWLASADDTRVPKRFVFDDFSFEAGSTRLAPGSIVTVNALAAVLKAYSAVSVALEGHTDNTGDPITNRKLSLDRAVAVKELMVERGIGASRIACAGFGQEKPVVANDTEQGRARNRRLELVVVRR
jgi:outer membrane protein OmpA-like peptidoglycan-associated protein